MQEARIAEVANIEVDIDNLSSLTIPKLKELAGEFGIDVPSGARKAEIIEYVRGRIIEQRNGINPTPITSLQMKDKMIGKYCKATDFSSQIKHLQEHGWTVIPIPDFDAFYYANKIFDFFEKCCPKGIPSYNEEYFVPFSRHDPKTWKAKNMPQLLHGILKHYVGHESWMWEIREKCAPIFAKLWNVKQEDLLSSFDGLCFLHSYNKPSQDKSWYHIDQGRWTSNLVCCQGIVNFLQNEEDDGGLVVVEGSHKIFGKYLEKHPSAGIFWGPVDMGDELLSKLPIVKVCAPPGSLILFDSRCTHCNIAPTIPNRMRMATYVCQMPRIGASDFLLQERIKLYEEGKMTGHWCYGPWFYVLPENPRPYGNRPPVRPPFITIAKDLSPLAQRLIGY